MSKAHTKPVAPTNFPKNKVSFPCPAVASITLAPGEILSAKILWTIVTFTSSQGTLPDRVSMVLFPISIHPNENEGKESVSNTNPFKNRRIPQNFNVTNGTGAYYPSLIDIENGNINQIVAKIGGQSQIVNIQYMGDSPFTLKRNIENNVHFNQVYHGDDPLETIITASQVEVYDIDDNYQPITQTRTFRVVVISPDVVRDIDSYKLYTFKSQEYAIKPINGDNYSENHEPMLYRNPIRQYFVCSADNKEYYQISDKFLDIKSDDRFKCNIVTSISPASSLIFYNNVKREESKDLANVIVDNAFSFNAINGSVLNDEFINYCVQQKSVDRQMCMVNMLTGGMSDAGSTAISAGIGYRSNMERAELAQIRSTWTNPGVSESNMYSRYAKQAAGMSIGGGALQMGANAINTYMSQKAKEKSIMNTPGKIGQTTDIASVIRISDDENSWSYLVTTKVDETAYELYKNIFKKFGYAIYGVITPDIKSRKYFNYIKTAGAILIGNVNQSILANLAVLFDKGMTIWHMDCTTKNTLYTYDKENIERTLMVADYHYTQIETVEDWNEAVSHLDIMKIGSRLRIVGTSGTDRLQSISWRNVNSDIWNADAGSPYTACDIHLDTAGTYEIYGTFKINGEFVDTNITRFKVIE